MTILTAGSGARINDEWHKIKLSLFLRNFTIYKHETLIRPVDSSSHGPRHD